MHETRSFKAARWVFLGFLTFFVLVPLYQMIMTSLKPLLDVQGDFTWFPSEVTFDAYVSMWERVALGRYILNSLIVSFTASTISVVVALFAAYAVSRSRFRARSAFMTTILSTQMFPGLLFLLPLYLLYVQIDQVFGVALIGTYWGMIITYLTFCLPFSTWMLASYLDGIPRELDDAASIDGAGVLRTIFQVIVPVSLPGLVAVWTFSFIIAWSEILFASVLADKNTRVVSLGLQMYATEMGVYWNEVMAASLVVSVPIVIFFILIQRYIISGFTAGSVK